jgi:hypothetical protein
MYQESFCEFDKEKKLMQNLEGPLSAGMIRTDMTEGNAVHLVQGPND